MDLLHISYGEVTNCRPVMMSGPVVSQFDNCIYCTPVMKQDLLYISYGEGTNCRPVMMGGPVVPSNQEGEYCKLC